MAPKRAEQDQRSVAHHTARHRSSTSSTPEDILGQSQRAPRSRRGRTTRSRQSFRDEVVHSIPAPDLPAPHNQPQPSQMSRGESTSTMRNSSVSLEASVTYTPTTHRVSKAKKGKRVHACEFPGCGKVFTRAEHKRRHEGNHNPEAPFPCSRSGCRKAFHRPDLLTRHLERHDLEVSEAASGHRRQSNLMSMSSGAPYPMATTSMQSSMTPVTASQQHSASISIGSLVNRRDNFPNAYHGYGTNLGVHETTLYPYNPYTFPSSDDPQYYSTPESSMSPRSDEIVRHSHRHSRSSASSVADFHPGMLSPLVSNILPSAYSPLPTPPSYLSTSMAADNNMYMPANPDLRSGSFFSDLDGFAYDCIRRELSSAFGVVSTGIFDNVRWQDCLNCYWQYFHPCFPILHQPTFFKTKPSPLLTGAMVAIGSQCDSRPDAKQYSIALLEICTRLLRDRSEVIKSSSKLADMQIVLLLETLRTFRSRETDTNVSPRFRTLYTRISEARQWSTTNPLAVFRNLRPNHTKDELVNAHRFWVDLESKRRIGHAAFCLDITQAVLFEQPLTVVRHSPPRLRTTDLKRPIAFPCHHDLWETSPLKQWAERASKAQDMDLAAATKATAAAGSLLNIDTFQSHLLLCHLMESSSSSSSSASVEAALFSLSSLPSNGPWSFTHSAFLAAQHTPIRDLLLVSGESWLLSHKIDNASAVEAAKTRLRSWVDEKTDSVTALWHATNLLRCVVDIDTPVERGDLSRFHKTYALHEEWCLYLSCLIVWAFSFKANSPLGPRQASPPAASTISTSQSKRKRSPSGSPTQRRPTVMDATDADAEMRAYLRATKASRAERLKRVDADIISRTRGLLESIRLRKIANGPREGGLLNEAEKVLFKLVEGKSRLSDF